MFTRAIHCAASASYQVASHASLTYPQSRTQVAVLRAMALMATFGACTSSAVARCDRLDTDVVARIEEVSGGIKEAMLRLVTSAGRVMVDVDATTTKAVTFAKTADLAPLDSLGADGSSPDRAAREAAYAHKEAEANLVRAEGVLASVLQALMASADTLERQASALESSKAGLNLIPDSPTRI